MKITIISLFTTLLFTASINAQSSDKGLFLKKYSIAVGPSLSTAPGLSLEAATSLTHRLNLRAGFVFMPKVYSFSYEYPLNLTDQESIEYLDKINADPRIFASAELASLSGRLLIDFTPAKDGLFYLTAGFIFGGSSIQFDGGLRNKTTDIKFTKKLEEYGFDYQTELVRLAGFALNFNDDTSMSATLYSAAPINPYLGIGIGNSIPHGRVGFKAELGVMYTGGFRLSSKNILDDHLVAFDKKDITPMIGEFVPELKDYQDFLRFSPVLNLYLVLRLN